MLLVRFARGYGSARYIIYYLKSENFFVCRLRTPPVPHICRLNVPKTFALILVYTWVIVGIGSTPGSAATSLAAWSWGLHRRPSFAKFPTPPGDLLMPDHSPLD